MAEENGYQVPVRTIARFMQILERQGLRQTFIDSAPQSLVDISADELFGLPDDPALFPTPPLSAGPVDLFVLMDHLRKTGNRTLAGATDVRLALSPALMSFARSFVSQYKLGTVDALMARIDSGDCPDPVECPQGV